jgi:hypothetical protein
MDASNSCDLGESEDDPSPLVHDSVQFLAFGRIKKVSLFAMNVLKLLDRLPPGDLPMIFKLAEEPTLVYVTQPFVDVVIRNKLYGAGFSRDLVTPSYLADPKLDNLDHWIH